VKFMGYIGKQEVLILLDSGSVETFIMANLVHNCALKTQSCESMNFATTNGSLMVSNTMVPQLTWFLQG
jgi:hypothetical protein